MQGEGLISEAFDEQESGMDSSINTPKRTTQEPGSCFSSVRVEASVLDPYDDAGRLFC